MLKILLVSDAWFPQVNGVVTTYQNVIGKLEERKDIDITVLHPSEFPTIACPFYPEINLTLASWPRIWRIIDKYQPDAIHIATEGPLGMCARMYCLENEIPFSTAYHTQFPHYLYKYLKLPKKITYEYLRWFHAPSISIMVPTQRVKDELVAQKFENLVVWTRGVHLDQYYPGDKTEFTDVQGPIFLYCGRVAKEKNIEEFLKIDLPGTKAVIGDGPARRSLEKRFPNVIFCGMQKGEKLASLYRSADVFVFPSLTDTFGVVMLEAMASGLPVAGFPVTGPVDVITDDKAGCLDWDLKKAALHCLDLKKDDCVDFARRFSWDIVAQQFHTHIQPFPQPDFHPEY